MMMTGAFLPSFAHAGVFSTILATLTRDMGKEHISQDVFKAVSLPDLATMTLPRAAMNIDPNPAKGGGDITIVDGSALLPEEGPSGTVADIGDGSGKNHEISIYVVREGDTLSHIAKMFDVDINTILWANDITDGVIHPGQTLAILPVNGIRYTVKTGGTLRDIIKKHGGDLQEAALFNGISPDTELEAGTVVVVPEAELHIAPAPSRSVTRVASAVVKSAGGPAIDGYFIHPAPGAVRTQGIHGYNAVDLGGPVGTPIVASASGDVIIVKSSGWNGGCGNYVVLKHSNGTQTLYAHTSENIVSPGQHVVQGQVIAYIGSTGRSTGPHVHFEIRGAKNPF